MANLYLRTCKWCGKQYDTSQAFRGGVSNNYSYCSVRCENAAKREQQKERQKQKEDSDEIFRLIGGGNAKKGGCLMVVAFLVIGFFIGTSNQGEEGKTKEIQEIVNTQPPVEVESNEQIMSVANQPELVDVGEETNDDWLPEPLVISERRTEVVEDENIIESDEIELEEEIKPDFSRQKVYDIVDVMPVYPDGEHELMEYIADNVEYPQEAIERGIEGRVFVKFIVEPDGSVSNVKIIRGIGYGCDEEAIRVIESMPAWKPGRENGEAVRVSMAAPVSFKLQ